MRRLIAAVSLLAVCGGLAACKKEPAPEGPKSIAQVAQESAGLPKPLPGLYRSEVEIVSMEAPGMPPQMADQMKRAMSAKKSSHEFCLTGEEAAKGYEERVKKLAGRPNCTFDRYAATAGALDAQMSCTAEGGIKSVLTMKGAMTPSGSDMTLAMTQTGSQMPGGSMKMTMHVKSARVGDCKS